MFDINELDDRFGDGLVTLAVSGGVDSMVMLHVIASNKEKFRCKFKVVHVDHGLMVESSAWSDLVHDVSRGYGLTCTTYKVDVPRDKNLENQARQARYMALALGSDAIVTAHHMDDQVETVLMKMMRASGPHGLMGMSKYGPCWFDNSILHCRPMLGISRDEIIGYAKVCGLRYIDDPSNTDQSYDRNWLRQSIIPQLRDRKAVAVANIAKSSAIMAETVEMMSALAEIDRQSVMRPDGHLDWPKMVKLGRTRLKNLIIHIIRQRTGRGCGTHHIEMFVDGLMAADSDSRNEMRIDGLRISKIGHKVVL